MPIKIQQTERGMVASASRPDGSATTTAFAPNLPPGPGSKVMAALAVAIDNYAAINNGNEMRLQIGALYESNAVAVGTVLRGPWIGVQAYGIGETQAIAAARTRALAVAPTTLANQAARDRVMKLWDATNVAGKARIGAEADLNCLSALIVANALTEVPDNIRIAIEDRAMALQYIATTGAQAEFALAPDLQDPIRTGPDVAACKAAADQIVANFRKRVEALDSVRTALSSTVAIAAVCSNLSAESAFELLSTGKLAA
jgi:hypothetical protein